MRLMPVLSLLLLALAAPTTAGAQIVDPAPPTVTTGAAMNIERTTATLTGTVDPNGSETTYRFEYGTTTAYGLQTADRDAGEGDGNVAVEVPVQNLSPGTTYHYRLIATNANGTTNGADRTFRTDPNPRPPGVTRTGTAQVAPDGAVLRSTIDPNDAATTYRFEYGPTRRYGNRTPDRTIPEGDGDVAITEQIGGLQPFRRYHFRLVATNAAGTTTSRDRRFVTSRLPTAITLSLDSRRVPWGEGVEVFGEVTGTGVGGLPVGLERQDFPFGGPFSSIGTPLPVRTDRSGRFRMFLPALFSTTRLRAVTRTQVAVISPVVTAPVAVRVGAAVRRRGPKRVRIRGSVRPAVPNGRAILQRRNSRGGWTFVKGANPRPLGESRSRYSFTVRRTRTPRRYRVRVIARDGGAHYPGNSRRVKVPAAARRRGR
jgi:hypothetical protein